MSFQQPGGPQMQVLFQADPNISHHLKSIRMQIHHICTHHVNQPVHVETIDGRVYEGVIVGCDSGHLYLSVPQAGSHRPVGPYVYNNVILPLVLYELLVITLMYT